MLSGEGLVCSWGAKMPRGQIPDDDLPEAIKRSPALERTGECVTSEEWLTTQQVRIGIASIGSEVMRATNSWVISWGRRIRLAELDGRLVVGHQFGE